jgi:hypothetical protein
MTRHRRFSFAMVALGLVSFACTGRGGGGNAKSEGQPNRAEGFDRGGELIRSIEKGMSASQVRGILGDPDGIWLHGPGDYAWFYSSYGVDVYFDHEGRVMERYVWMPETQPARQ